MRSSHSDVEEDSEQIAVDTEYDRDSQAQYERGRKVAEEVCVSCGIMLCFVVQFGFTLAKECFRNTWFSCHRSGRGFCFFLACLIAFLFYLFIYFSLHCCKETNG